MPREYKSYDELRKNIEEKFADFTKIDWEYLNDRGVVLRRTYGILVDVFEFAENLAEVVEDVSEEIFDLLHPRGFVHVDAAVERECVALYLKKYVRHNIDKELWKDVPEFQN